jgi:hypothetical protein
VRRVAALAAPSSGARSQDNASLGVLEIRDSCGGDLGSIAIHCGVEVARDPLRWGEAGVPSPALAWRRRCGAAGSRGAIAESVMVAPLCGVGDRAELRQWWRGFDLEACPSGVGVTRGGALRWVAGLGMLGVAAAAQEP